MPSSEEPLISSIMAPCLFLIFSLNWMDFTGAIAAVAIVAIVAIAVAVLSLHIQFKRNITDMNLNVTKENISQNYLFRNVSEIVTGN